jgi:Gas vesicle synthesis protein GvpL/GvpF
VTPLVYVYALAPISVAATDGTISGIGGERIRWITEGDLQAAVSDVPEEEFGEEALNSGLTDMQWLGPRALAHQDVNRQLHEQSDALIPLAFGTVFRDDARVRAMLREQQTSLLERLDRVRGCSEWVVAVHQTTPPDPQQATSVQELHAQIATAAPGRAHLLRKRLGEVEREAARQLTVEAVERVVQALERSAEDVYLEPLPSETVERPLLRASVLVRRADEHQFLETVDSLQTQAQRVLVTGPWPAYRFAGLEHAAATA